MLMSRVVWTLNTFIVILGYDDLSANKRAAEYRTVESCSTCKSTNAVDRNIGTCMRTIMGRTSPDQFTWWYVDLGEIHSVYNIRIQFRDYEQEYGCSSSGVYGENCDKPCPENCHERRCDIINGTCLGCTHGWLGEYCTTACPVGYYGFKCESKCARHCKNSKTCNHTSGLCDNGCDDGWTGSNCTKECPQGTYGPDCVHKCSGKCLGDVACNRTTGHCDSGCDFGYTGDLCETGCEIGTFGKGCSNQCSGHCLHDVPCNSTTGHCDSGCASGYVGPFCNKTCNDRKYGLECLQNCSIDCKDELCNNADGTCICRNGNQGFLDCSESDLDSNAFSDSCNEPSYIAGISVLVIICIILGSVCLFLMWKYYRLLKKMRSLQYTSITRTSTQDNNTNSCQQYEELRISENGYHNIELRN